MLALGFDFGSVYVKAALLDEQGRLLDSLQQKQGAAAAPALAGFLARLERDRPRLRVRAGLTGSEDQQAPAGSITLVHGLLALGAGVRGLHPDCARVLEVGGQTSKYLVLDPAGGLRDFATSGACAAGTGAFLEQQARRLDLGVPELARLAAGAERAATVAGRCSVFAASDMVHLQQKGAPLAEIAGGLCAAIARNALATLLKGREPELPLLLAGGCARNQGIQRAFRDLLAPADPGGLVVSAQPGLEAAVGAALLAARGPAVALAELAELIAGLEAGARREPRTHPPLRPPAERPRAAEAGSGEGGRGYLGIDVGSVSTDLVLLDPAGGLLASVYLATRGRPAEVLLEGLGLLGQRFGGRLQVLGCGATGSGRHLAGKLAGADVVKNEITCQLLGARQVCPDVDTILEIGGQDSKYIAARDGALTDFAMNKVCAAGTGSFLEERSRDLGIDIHGEFAARAFAARAPLDLGSRCTVFMATEVVNALAQGAAVEDICAGLALAVVRNYLDKVVGTRSLGRRILLQGGVASNEAVVAAFEQVLGRPVQVHPHNRISGAIGAALAARAAAPGKAAFHGFQPGTSPELSSFECQQCPNRCEVNVIATGAGRSFFGDTCERYTSGGERRECPLPDLAEAYLDRAADLVARDPVPGPRIGLPRASSLVGQLPFWAAFWKHLGRQPVLSPASSRSTLALGLRHLPMNVCLPIRLTAGHVHALLAQGLEQVFVPAVLRLPGSDPAGAHACPYTMAMPFIIDAPGGDRVLAPVLSFDDEEAFAAGFDPCRDRLGASREQIRQGFQAGMAAQDAVTAEFRARARDLLAAGGHRHAFGILGRPYAVFDSYVNLGLFERLRRLGVLALPMAFLPDPPGPAPALPWRYPGDILGAAAGLRSGPIHPVVLSSYGCGPDAFTLQRLGECLRGRPQLTLELDEHRGEAGLVTRIEAFLDQLEAPAPARSPAPAPRAEPTASPAVPAPVWIPCFADHAYAYSGLLRHLGHAARVLPPPTAEIQALGERHSPGKECHAYPMLLGDLLHLAGRDLPKGSVFFFPGTSIPCLLHEYGRGMQALLGELGIDRLRVWSPTGQELLAAAGVKPLERFYSGLLAIEILVKAAFQIRPYERTRGLTDLLHQENLEAIEAAVAGGDVRAALDQALARLAQLPRSAAGGRPVVGLVGDLYTRTNPVANHGLAHWLEQQGLEVWPSPFQIDLLDFGISRNLARSLADLDLPGLLAHGSIALLRAVQHWRMRSVVGARVARPEEPSYEEQKRLAAPYMANEAHELLFLQIAKTVDFAQAGANGIANAICFGCMVGNAAAAVNERIRRDFDGLPILTAVYTGAEDPSRRLALEAFVGQVRAHHQRHPQPGGLARAAI